MKQKYVTGKINKITKNFFSVVIEGDKKGLVYINDISDYYINDINRFFEIGEEFELLIKYFKDDIYFCDFKTGRADYLNFPFEYKIKETKNKFENLYNYNEQEVLKWKK